MSTINEAFKETRISFGLQKPNWSGIVYGACMNPKCPNYRKIGYYEGGFCKMCRIRHPDDKKLSVLAIIDKRRGIVGPNPKIRWLTPEKPVLDLSHTLSEREKSMFYMTPEQRAKMMDRVDYQEPQEEEPDFNMEREKDEPDEEDL